VIRAFIGIPLPREVAEALEAAQAGIPAGRVVPYENFHVTLAFLGEQPRPVLEDVHDALDGVRVPGFWLRIEGLGMFGGPRPRVLFAEVAAEPGLAQLRRKVLRAVQEAGIELGRERFRPHVTLARFGARFGARLDDGGLRGEDAAEMQAFVARRLGLRAGPFAVESFVLYRSHLGRAGPIYEALAEYPLAGPAGAGD
jgi:RNA 2',3'-cyclic 3'-phosphodiesterase